MGSCCRRSEALLSVYVGGLVVVCVEKAWVFEMDLSLFEFLDVDGGSRRGGVGSGGLNNVQRSGGLVGNTRCRGEYLGIVPNLIVH